MEHLNEEILKFTTACDELIAAKYAAADTKIAEVLRAVAQSKELENLFSAVTKDFDFLSAKRDYLRFPAFQGSAHGTAFLPAERGDVLAFVFCLLVEFDAGATPLGDFLLRYFYEDGSYTASYTKFAESMIVPFRDIVKSCFPDALRVSVADELEERAGAVLQSVSEWTEAETVRMSRTDWNVGEKVAAETILSQIKTSAARSDVFAVKALACGYRYFLLYHDAQDETSEAIFSFINTL